MLIFSCSNNVFCFFFPQISIYPGSSLISWEQSLRAEKLSTRLKSSVSSPNKTYFSTLRLCIFLLTTAINTFLHNNLASVDWLCCAQTSRVWFNNKPVLNYQANCGLFTYFLVPYSFLKISLPCSLFFPL